MMILNQVTRAFTSRKRRTTTIFRRQKIASTITIDNEVENNKDDCHSLKNNPTVDEGEIISATSNSSTTIDLTPCSSARCVIITTTSSKSWKRPDSIDIIRIPPVPTLLKALNSDNADNAGNADDITLCSIPSLRRSTSITDDNDLDDTICTYDDDDDESYFDCDDSCIYAPPPVPVPFVCVPQNFSHADSLLQTTQDNNCDIHNNILLSNRPPTRLGDWDDHTIASNPDDDDELPDTGNNKGKRRNTATVTTGTRTSSSMTMKLLADRRHQARRHQARTILSQNFPQLAASTSSHNNDTNTLTLRKTLLSTLSNDDGKQQQQERQHSNQEEQQQQRQPRVVKWNMVR